MSGPDTLTKVLSLVSVVKTLQAIEQCNVVVLLLDGASEIADQDAHIAGFILESGRALVIAVNKWDLIEHRSPAPVAS